MSSGPQRLEELLIDRATEGLTEDQSEELNRLQSEFPHLMTDELDLAAAAVELACFQTAEVLPPAIRAKLAQTALEVCGSERPGPASG